VSAKLRVALYHNLPSGGAKRTVLETVRRLVGQHEVDLFCPATANVAFCDVGAYVRHSFAFPYQRTRPLRSPFGRLNPVGWMLDLWRMEVLARRVARAIDDRGYDVVLVHPCVVSQAPSVLPFLRTPSVYYCHESLRGIHEPAVERPYSRPSRHRRVLDRLDPLMRAHRLAVRGVDRRNIRAASAVLTNSAYTRETIRRIYAVDARVNHPAVDATAFAPRGLPRDRAVVSVGALTPEKGFDFLIASLGTLPAPERPPLTLVSNFEIAAERAYLSALAEERGVRVAFRTGISNDDLVDLYGRAALTVYAPIREPLGLAPLESQACCTPVVGVREGGVAETVVHGRTGRLVDRDPAAFGAAVRSLLADEALRERYGRAGRAHVLAHWTWESSVVELEDALRRAAAGHPKGARLAPATAGNRP
jgi:glycosyltransferase involved in cell wall biosynthesis